MKIEFLKILIIFWKVEDDFLLQTILPLNSFFYIINRRFCKNKAQKNHFYKICMKMRLRICLQHLAVQRM